MNAELLAALQAAQMALMGYTHQNDITRAALAQAATAIENAKKGECAYVTALEHLAKYGRQCDVKFIASEALKKGGAA